MRACMGWCKVLPLELISAPEVLGLDRPSLLLLKICDLLPPVRRPVAWLTLLHLAKIELRMHWECGRHAPIMFVRHGSEMCQARGRHVLDMCQTVDMRWTCMVEVCGVYMATFRRVSSAAAAASLADRISASATAHRASACLRTSASFADEAR